MGVLRYCLLLLMLQLGQVFAAERVVTTGMCTDAWAIQLLPPQRIAALTYLARNPALSLYVHAAQAFPQHNGSLEDILRHSPDVVLADAWVSRITQQRLESLGVRVVRLPAVTRLAQWPEIVTMLGAQLNVPARAAALLNQTPSVGFAPPAGKRARVAIYHIGGYGSGAQALEGDIVTAAGGVHLGAQWGTYGWVPLPLERLLLSNPDLLVLDSQAAAHSQAARKLHHPALTRAKAHWAVYQFPERAWLCLTPTSFTATKDLARAIEELGP